MTSEALDLPPKTDRRWSDLVLGVNSAAPKLLALKFMLTRIALAASRDPSPASVQKGVEELYAFFQANPRIVAADVATLFR